MSDTEITTVPPVNVFIAEPNGLTRWRAAFDEITVHAGLSTLRLELRRGVPGNTVWFELSADEADHLASVLAEKAAQIRGRAGE